MDDSVYNITGICTSLAIVGLYVLIIYLLIKMVIFQTQEVLENEDYENKYGPLYEEYKTTRWIYKSFYMFEASRR